MVLEWSQMQEYLYGWRILIKCLPAFQIRERRTMRTYVQKPSQSHAQVSSNLTSPKKAPFSANCSAHTLRPSHSLLPLQRTINTQTAQRPLTAGTKGTQEESGTLASPRSGHD